MSCSGGGGAMLALAGRVTLSSLLWYHIVSPGRHCHCHVAIEIIPCWHWPAMLLHCRHRRVIIVASGGGG